MSGGRSRVGIFVRSPRVRGVAQLVARLVWDQEVAGSNPAAPSPGVRPSIYAPVAQWIEHLPSKQVVAGSIPAGRRFEAEQKAESRRQKDIKEVLNKAADSWRPTSTLPSAFCSLLCSTGGH
jgi:hypothetical protein